MSELESIQRVDDAHFSPCGVYRYMLSRELGGDRPLVICGLNPSVATADKNDPTIRKECEFARRWGFGRLIKVNARAFVATDPRVVDAAIRSGIDVVGPDNDRWIREMCELAYLCDGRVLVAWGAHLDQPRAAELLKIILGDVDIYPVCLGKNKNGSPKHPLYLSYETPLEPWP